MGGLEGCSTGRELLKLRSPGITQTCLCGQGPGVCMLIICSWESLALTNCPSFVVTVSPCQGSCQSRAFPGEECAQPTIGSRRGVPRLRSLYGKFHLLWGQLCPATRPRSLRQQTCPFLPLKRNSWQHSLGVRAREQKVHSGPRLGHLLFRACIPGSLCGSTPAHTSMHKQGAEGLRSHSLL